MQGNEPQTRRGKYHKHHDYNVALSPVAILTIASAVRMKLNGWAAAA